MFKRSSIMAALAVTMTLVIATEANALVAGGVYLLSTGQTAKTAKTVAIAGSTLSLAGVSVHFAASAIAGAGAAIAADTSGLIGAGLEFLMGVGGPVLAGIGVIILKDDGGVRLQYQRITNSDQAAAFQLTENELNAYNQNVDSFNAIYSDLASRPGQLTAEQCTQLWQQDLDAVGASQEARVALAKVNKNLFNLSLSVNK